MTLKDKIKTLIKRIQYKKYIEEHRTYIKKAFIELTDCLGLSEYLMDDEIYYKLQNRIQNHDMSKYSEEEFEPYRKQYYPINAQEKENNKDAFQKAWIHHLECNDHHWQHRQNNKTFDKENMIAILENVCDWLAMGYKFHDRPYQYYEKHKDEIHLPEEDKKFLEKIIYIIK